MIALHSPTGSIRRRLFLQLAVVAALLSLAFFFILRFVAEGVASDTQDNILAASATAIADAIYLERDQIRLELPYSALSMLGTISDDRVFYRVIADGQTLTGYDDLPKPKTTPVTGQAIFSTQPYRGDQVRLAVVARPISQGSRTRLVEVIVGQTRQGLAAISSRITAIATAIGVMFFLIATGLSALGAHLTLAPIERLAATVGRRGPNDLRPVTAPTPQEMGPLVNALNNFMERLRASLTRSEDLISEAAHRVRTPLATVRTQAEVIHRQMKREENRRAMRDMIRAVDESSRSAGQLLDHAMVTFRSDQLEMQDIDLAALLVDTVERITPTADLKDIQIRLTLPGTPIKLKGDAVLLQNAMRNILDNAIKYSPAETSVDVIVKAGQFCVIQFIDQGRGFPDGDASLLKERFTRGANAKDVVGSGLGLTIAEDVASSHGGSLEISQKLGGIGACVSLILPSS